MPFSTPTECGHCGAPLRPGVEACEHCGTRVPNPVADLSTMMDRMEGILPGPGPAFHLMHGSGFILVGAVFTATVVGAIVGIPAILFGLNSWRRAWRAWKRA